MRVRLIAVLVPLLVLAMGMVGTAAAAPGNGGERVDVIVVLHDGEDARDAARDAHRNHNADVSFVYEHALQGFAGSVPEGRLHALERDPRVDYVEFDREFSIQLQSVPTGIDRIFAEYGTDTTTAGINVDVAVIDTGIDFEHPDLNVVGGVDCTVSSGGGPPWARDYNCSSTEGTGGDDDHYHGTHVAGTIGAIDNETGVVGVAPGARLHAVKVLDSSGSGYTSGIVAGIEWVIAQETIEVLNMSLGGSGSCDDSAYDTAITNAVGSGIAVAVAAGNSDADANNYSPASCTDAFTVSALADYDGAPGGSFDGEECYDDQDDTLADFSNWGTAIDIAAPGVCILSTYPIEQGEYGTISGTSMASPHAAGALALLAAAAPNSPETNKGATEVKGHYDELISTGNCDWFDDSGDGIHEPLLDLTGTATGNCDGDGDGDSGTPNEPPTASFSHDCTDDPSCTFDGSSSSDTDGTVENYEWDFGDGNSSSGETETTGHTYTANGDYTVTLTVTDDQGATDSQSLTVSITGVEATDGITLSATGNKIRGQHTVDLTWSGATSTNVDVYRNGVLEATTANDGEWTWSSSNRGGATYTFQVCEAGTSTCSNESTVTF